MAELGVFGANLPEEYGCAGLNNVRYGLIMQELERGDSRRALVRVGAGRARDVSDLRVRQRGAEDEVAAEDGRRARSSAASASPSPTTARIPAGMITRAREQKDGSWILNGAKMWITNGSTAHIAIVWAKTGRRHRREVDPRLHRPDGHARASRRRTRRGSSRCARRDTSELVFRTCIFPPTRSSRVAAGSRARSCASRRRATASRGARSARRWRASRRRSRTPSSA